MNHIGADPTEEKPLDRMLPNVLKGGRRLLQILVLVLLALAPLDVAPATGFTAWVAGFLLIGLACLYPLNESAGYLPKAGLAFLAFLAWVGLGLGHSLNYFHTERSLAAWVAGFAVFLAISEVHHSSESLRTTLHGLSGIATLYALVSLVATYAGGVRGGSLALLSFPDTGSFTAFLMAGFGISLALVLHRNRLTLEWWILNLESSILALAIALTGSVLGLLGLLVTLAVIIAFSLKSVEKLSKRKKKQAQPLELLFGPGVALAVLIVVVLFLGNGVDSTRARADEAAVTQQNQLAWKYGWKAFARSPLLGAGLGNFDLAFQPVQPSPAGYVRTASSLPLQLLVVAGLPGAALLGAAFFLAMVPFYRSGDRTARRAALAALVGILVVGLGTSQSSAVSILWMSALLGLATLGPRGEKAATPRYVLQGSAVAALVLLLAGVQEASFGHRLWVGTRLAGQAAVQANEHRGVQSLVTFSEALQRLPEDGELYLQRGLVYERAAQSTGKPVLVSAARQDIDDAWHWEPIGESVPYAVGSFYVRNGEPDRGLMVLRQASDWYPQDTRRAEALAEAYTRRGDFSAALRYYRMALGDNPAMEGRLAEILYKMAAAHEDVTPVLNRWATTAPETAALVSRLCVDSGEIALNNHTPDLCAPFLAVLDAHPPTAPCDLMGQVRLLEGAGRTEAAEALFWKVTLKNNDTAFNACASVAMREMATYLVARDEYTRAETLLSKYLASHMDDELRALLGDVYDKTGDIDRAIAAYREVEERDNNNARYTERLGDLLLKKGEKALALVYFEQAAQMEPANAEYTRKAEDLHRLTHPGK